ncbi:TomO hydrophobic C-terminal domain-containing protein [Wolbachia endosymbiont (group B) of Eucosma cana]|uniref:TomO hydrophobic C-terminal domain-containing protein n=1 Tax=Wolbachia endosymbiont (group B) of Eucosma cana TaxID=2954012 RepID=UPI002226E756|nr:hypothetical protein [Wolbachia endosymbiont (group B) of Eucosma cana]
MSACKLCLSRYSKVINDIEKEYNHLNNEINNEKAIDSILKRLDQVTTVLNQFNEYQIQHASTLFVPIAVKLEGTIKSMEGYGNVYAEELKQHKLELELLKGIIVNQEVDILIPKIQELNDRAKLLQDNIRNSGIQTPSKKVNTTPVVKNVALPNQVGIAEESSPLDRKVRLPNPKKRTIFKNVQQVLQPKNSVSDVSNVHTTKYVEEKLVVTVENGEDNLEVKGNQQGPQPEVLPSAFNSNFNNVVVTGENVKTPTLEQKNSIQDNNKQLTNSDNKDDTLLLASGTENLYLPESGNSNYHNSPALITSPPVINEETEQNDTKTNKRQLNNSGNRNTTITQSTQRTIIAITLATIAIPAALIAHFVFQASLLTTGIIAGYCLIAAVVTYCASKPSSALESSDAKVVANKEVIV